MSLVQSFAAVSVYILTCTDILVNASGDLFGESVIGRLSVYSVQDLSLILSFIIFVIQFFRKEVLESGKLLPLILRNSRTMAVIVVYFCLTIVLQTLIVTRMRGDATAHKTPAYFWPKDPIVVVTFIAHRLTSGVYYLSFHTSITRLHHESRD